MHPECAPGNSCTKEGETCVYSKLQDMSGIVTCLREPPKIGVGGCPKSSARFKRDIHYLTAAERQQLSDAILKTKLSKYYHKDGVSHDQLRQLGFIIEDQPADSIFVNDDKTHVNLYAFTSGAVAAIQQLKDELAQQQETIKQLKDELERVKKKSR